jgi:hypothetical protein
MGRLATGVIFLGFAALFALFVWWNHNSGIATVNWAVSANRNTNPIGFWVIQVFLGFVAAICALCGAAIVFFGMGPSD